MFAHAFAYKQWADQRTLQAVATLDATAQSAALAFVCQQLNHMLIVEELFRARLLGLPAPHAATNTVSLPALDELQSRLHASDNWFADYATTLAPASRDEIIRFVFADGQAGSMSREEILFHIINHGTYHRGAIGHALEQAGAARPADTYTLYIHAAEPQRRGD
ncbi:DinB family protein [Aquitalea sp. LB_tupeE]|uniref:DinB family protein n=1 Tax=Aquitalea sp. LB_tupeE TaxID=2748078 RepID=UPI0015C01877|nr:DinB family protein [Aquitalea sp. LB_tupeE]NWK79211.1 DinB family protein [Aquitalea sp. LB_tupeE]